MFLSGGWGGGGAKEERMDESFFGRGGHAWEFLFLFLSDGECFYNDKAINFFSTPLVMLLLGLKFHHH